MRGSGRTRANYQIGRGLAKEAKQERLGRERRALDPAELQRMKEEAPCVKSARQSLMDESAAAGRRTHCHAPTTGINVLGIPLLLSAISQQQRPPTNRFLLPRDLRSRVAPSPRRLPPAVTEAWAGSAMPVALDRLAKDPDPRVTAVTNVRTAVGDKGKGSERLVGVVRAERMRADPR